MGMPISALPIAHIDGANLKIVMHILHRPRRHFFQNFFKIGYQKWLGFLHQDCHCCMETLNIYYSSLNSRLSEFFFDFIGNVNEVKCRRRFEIDDVIY
jgi:hypothetical protein